ncbi:MAG: hypothetical protein ACI837_000047 [Crocinitomicaceae bacterium]|jgi:hypothetical protein
MKKILITILAFTGVTLSSSAQIVSIEIGASGDISGTQYDITSAGAEVILDVEVHNLTADSMNLEVSREWLTHIASWQDYICWGHETDPFGGKCYPIDSVNTVFTGDTPVMIHENEGGSLSIHIFPNAPDAPDYGCDVYRYRILNGEIEVDYIDISVCKTIGVIEVNPSILFSMAPNPASSTITISSNELTQGNLTMTNTMGQIATKTTFEGMSKTIDISSFKNGIYFITVETEEGETSTQKIIVNH